MKTYEKYDVNLNLCDFENSKKNLKFILCDFMAIREH